MQYYSQQGHQDFVLCLGHKANLIKDYFLGLRAHYVQRLHHIQLRPNGKIIGDPYAKWRITMVDTGISHNIGERLMAVGTFR